MSTADMRANMTTLQACAAASATRPGWPPVHDITNSYGLAEPSPGVGIYLVGTLPQRLDRPIAEGLLVVAARKLTAGAPEELRHRHTAGVIAAATGQCPLCGQIAKTLVDGDGVGHILPLHYSDCRAHYTHEDIPYLAEVVEPHDQ